MLISRHADFLQEKRREADERGVIVVPTLQFYKSESHFQHRDQYLPGRLNQPWHTSGLLGIHINEVKQALREIISKPISFWGLCSIILVSTSLIYPQ